jgi:hypothetical protein
MLDLAVFVPRLKQVIAWTAHLAQNFDCQTGNYGTVFRQLNPVINGQLLYGFNDGYIDWKVDVYDLNNCQQALQIAFEQRDTQQASLNFEPSSFQELGRILYFEMQLTTNDGAASAESDCFVDESDVPPIDTWFYLDQNLTQQAKKASNLFCCLPKWQVERAPKLFCWIPKQFESVMQAAISVEIFDSYHWLDEVNPLTHQQIVAAISA